MRLSPRIVALVIAIICFALALLTDVSTFTANHAALDDAGFIATALALLIA